MMCGTVVQTASPEDLYHRPATRFVAQFLGEANLLPVADGTVAPFGLPAEGGRAGSAVIRPEDLQLVDTDGGLGAVVTDVVSQGARLRVSVRADGLDMPLVVSAAPSEVADRPVAGARVGLHYRGPGLRTLQETTAGAA